MTQEEFKEFLEAQKEAIDVWKWFLGEKIGRDPGQEGVREWIRQHAQEFRDSWPSYSAEYRKRHPKN